MALMLCVNSLMEGIKETMFLNKKKTSYVECILKILIFSSYCFINYYEEVKSL
jgi:hypothetical protein